MRTLIILLTLPVFPIYSDEGENSWKEGRRENNTMINQVHSWNTAGWEYPETLRPFFLAIELVSWLIS